MDIIIRAMLSTDWNEVAAIYQEGIDTKFATFQKEIPVYEAWDNSHVQSCRLVAEAEGNVIGWAALSPYSSRCVYSGVAEVSIYIKADYRGKKVGEKLLMELIEESEAAGYWTLQSGIIEINEASQALHKKLGFRMVGYRERIAKDHNGEWQNTVLMERRSTVIGV
ncbi:MAG: phosphinothricin acetyltransferase [Herbinix sp.]|jgi:phosphinothricin acetyltransferase|nr:phosphinothricin acetyltransferase [Herbinix sp.]